MKTGGTLFLEINPARICDVRWIEAYHETLDLLLQHPTLLMGVRVRAGRREFTRSLEQGGGWPDKRRWLVVGDLTSLLTADAFVMPWASPREPAQRDSNDIVITQGVGSRPIMGGQHHNHPYAEAVLAAAALIEDHMPTAAMAHGDWDRASAQVACAWASAHLGRPIKLPVVVRAEGLLDRLQRVFKGVALLERFNHLYQGPRHSAAEHLRQRFAPQLHQRWLLRRLARLRDPDALGDILHMGALLGMTKTSLRHLACAHLQGPRLDAAAVQQALNAPWPPPPPPPPSLPHRPLATTFEALLAITNLNQLPTEALIHLTLWAWRRLHRQPLPSLSAAQTLQDAAHSALRTARIALTQDAWARLDALSDPPTLHLLRALALESQPSLLELRRALLENTPVCQQLAHRCHDPAIALACQKWLAALT